MNSLDRLPRPASARELAILRHPDQQTSWVGVLVATLRRPDPDLAAAVPARLEAMSRVIPILGARWRSGRWWPDAAPTVIVDATMGPAATPVSGHIDLAREPPLRVVVDPAGRWLLLAGHHAAFDGRSLLTLAQGLVGQPAAPAPSAPEPSPTASSLREPLRRILQPADPVAASVHSPPGEVVATRVLEPHGAFTGRLAQACVEAAQAHNMRFGRPWRRVGLSVAYGGQPGVGNLASYRRIDLRAGDRVAPAVHRALAGGVVPLELVFAPRALRLLAPLRGRFSDSLLISDLGRIDQPLMSRVELYPHAHGRSGVAFGAAEVSGGLGTLSMRARDLNQADAEMLLEDAVARLTGASDPGTPVSYHQIGARP